MALSAGEVLVEAKYISVDPYMRINQSLKPTYNAEPHPLNAVQNAGVVGRIIASQTSVLAVGDWVEGLLGWQTHARCHHSTIRKLDRRWLLSARRWAFWACRAARPGLA